MTNLLFEIDETLLWFTVQRLGRLRPRGARLRFAGEEDKLIDRVVNARSLFPVSVATEGKVLTHIPHILSALFPIFILS